MNPAPPTPSGRFGVEGPLHLAVPRGALFGACLDLLERAGFDTAPARGDSRALIFDLGELTIVTMRPSDVPTYVEAGAADLGITGKDVLRESPRDVLELADLGFGSCRMVVAARAGDDSLELAARRLGRMRIATKYRRTAEEFFERTGRQAEVIEVKGSVELAPLVGLADGIVDLVDSGRTLAENGLEVREEIATSTARLIANRVSHKLRVEELDRTVDLLRRAATGSR
jgi:ATP phosphoribosyltransferase